MKNSKAIQGHFRADWLQNSFLWLDWRWFRNIDSRIGTFCNLFIDLFKFALTESGKIAAFCDLFATALKNKSSRIGLFCYLFIDLFKFALTESGKIAAFFDLFGADLEI